MPSAISGEGYSPSSSSQKGYRHDYGRGQSVTEGQGSVNEAEPEKLCHSESNSTVLPSSRAETPQEASVDIYKAIQKAYNNALQHKEYQILEDLWKNFLKSFLTVKKLLGHPNHFKLLNG
ncbi:hypothetical protein O181_117750 [Austropuccinia psidii MF-1]|uniref:Uncharacterized protein n=1 Tax=Austropuccinia psidii MF-1 TaxID=1389203 RepID=A0A9Q3KEZ6_9BASI|nr:hypothetical protein [Austropuccinia psidii MF-1]